MTAKAGGEKYFQKYLDNLTGRRLAPEKAFLCTQRNVSFAINA